MIMEAMHKSYSLSIHQLRENYFENIEALKYIVKKGEEVTTSLKELDSSKISIH